MPKFRVLRTVLGMVRTNCYILINEETRQAVLFDPADDAGRIAAFLDREGVTPAGILLTHGHFDHIGAADALRAHYGIRVYLLKEEVEVAGDAGKNLSALWAQPLTLTADTLLSDGQELTLAGFSIRVLHTPGHTAGSACYYLPQERLLFSGDTLFCESCGRTDFPTGSAGALARSVKSLLSTLPEDVRVCPGHEDETDIAHEKRYNPLA